MPRTFQISGGKQNLLAKVGSKEVRYQQTVHDLQLETMGRIVSSRIAFPCNLALMVSSHFLQGASLFSHHFWDNWLQ